MVCYLSGSSCSTIVDNCTQRCAVLAIEGLVHRSSVVPPSTSSIFFTLYRGVLSWPLKDWWAGLRSCHLLPRLFFLLYIEVCRLGHWGIGEPVFGFAAFCLKIKALSGRLGHGRIVVLVFNPAPTALPQYKLGLAVLAMEGLLRWSSAQRRPPCICTDMVWSSWPWEDCHTGLQSGANHHIPHWV
jgi:hypothetical protein